MALTITPEVLSSAYDFLRTTAPFKGWRMPHSDEIEFRVTRDRTEHGHYNRFQGTDIHWIAMSEVSNGHTDTLLMYMAHEMVHLHQALARLETKGTHNADFKRRAKAICAVHGWDPKVFA